MADNVQIDYNVNLRENLYDILYKWITEDELEDTREGIEAFGYKPLDEEGEETDETPNSITGYDKRRSINDRQNNILLNLAENLAMAVESWTTKQTFNITEMEAPINIEKALHTTPTAGAPAAPGQAVSIPVITLEPVFTQGTAEIGQTKGLAAQNTNSSEAIDTSKVKLLEPEMTI